MGKNGVSQEHIEPPILTKIQIYILTRAELLNTLCYEIPCNFKTRDFSPLIERVLSGVCPNIYTVS